MNNLVVPLLPINRPMDLIRTANRMETITAINQANLQTAYLTQSIYPTMYPYPLATYPLTAYPYLTYPATIPYLSYYPYYTTYP